MHPIRVCFALFLVSDSCFLLLHGRFKRRKGCEFHSLSFGNRHEFTRLNVANLFCLDLYVGEFSKSSNFDVLVVVGDILLWFVVCGLWLWFV